MVRQAGSSRLLACRLSQNRRVPIVSIVTKSRPWAAILFLLVLQTALAGRAYAQNGQEVLSDAQVTQTSFDEARLALAFSQNAPSWTSTGNGSAHLEIVLPNTREDSGVALKPSGELIRSVQTKPQGQDLILIVDTTAPVQVSAVPLPPNQYRRLLLSFKKAGPGTDAPAPVPLVAPQGPLPHTLDPPPGEDGFEMIPLKYADVSEVVGLLTNGVTVKSNDTFTPSEPGFGSQALAGGGQNNYNPASTQDKSDDDPLGQAVDDSLAVDRRLNAIWVRGSPDHIARVKQEIAMIDIPLDSVVLETQFVELTEVGQKALGIDFTNANGQIGVVTFASGEFVPSFGGPTSGHQVSAQFQAALYAQIAKGNGRIMSAPRIAAQSGSTAKIITGDALPILTSIALSGVNGVSQQVQYVNVGVTLQIAPRVSSDGFISSHVFAVVSSVTGYQQGYPTISQREAETSATVHDGDSFVIGGLTQDDVLNSKSKIPLLGDIPLIGQAFRTDKSSMSKTELYIVITPHIVHRLSSAAASASAPAFVPITTTTQTLIAPPAAAPPAHR